MTDGELLQLYAANRDGAAFAEIVRRHGGMVHAAARRLAREDAEDVTQAVFLLLARKASKLARHRSIAGWLYSAARYCAANARRTRGRRERQLERYQQREAAMTRSSTASSEHDSCVPELLDAGLAKLKDDQRQAVLLRYIEGLTLEEAGVRLGINAAAVAKRAERGIARLREYFAARGVTLSDAALAATPIPASMAASLSEFATGSIPATGAMIAAAAGQAMTLSAAVKVAAVVMIAAAGVALTVAVADAMKSTAPKQAQAASMPIALPATPASPATPPPPPAAPPALTQETGRERAMQFTRAIRDRDEEAVARLLIASSPDEARAAAAGFIAQIRDGLYAQFPQRLDQITGSMFTTSQQGEMTSAVLTTNTPTDADIARLSIRLEARDGTWRVRDAKISAANAMLETAEKAPLPTVPADPRVPPGTYAKAAALSQSFQSRLNYPAEAALLDKDKAAVVANMQLAQTDLSQLAVVLRPTDLAIPEATVTAVNKWLEASRLILERDGAAAFFKRGEEIQKDPAFMAEAQKVWGIDATLGTRAGAESQQQQQTGARPPSFAPPITLTLAWDNTQQTLPGPVTMPSWFRESQAFKTWQKRHNIQTFRTRDDVGNTYEIHCLGGVKEPDGRTYDVITSVSLFRPDGTLAAAADYDHYGQATGWIALDATGKVLTTSVSTRSGRDRSQPPQITQVTFFEAHKNQRVWEVRANNVVTMEILKDPIGGPIKTLRAAPKPNATRPATMRAKS